jgi:DNA mismatch repair ATPase MutS
VVYPRGRLNGQLKSWLRNSTSLAVWSSLAQGHKDDEFWPANVTRCRITELFDQETALPQVLQHLMREDSGEVSEECDLALNALGGAMSYLKKLGLDRDLLSLHNFQDLHGLGDNGPKCMLLDIQTLNGLDVLEAKGTENKGRTVGGGMTCLWHYLDRAVTPFGRRLLRYLSPPSPSRSVDHIYTRTHT